MRMRRSLAATLALTAVVVVAAPAEAKKITHRGSVVGIPSAKVKFKVQKDDGELERIVNLRFNRVPVTCEDGAGGVITAELPNFGIDGRKFTRKGPVRGVGIENGTLRAFGKLRSNGKRATGNVKIAFRSGSGSGCGTGHLKWKTS
jgi:hypothetical protein